MTVAVSGKKRKKNTNKSRTGGYENVIRICILNNECTREYLNSEETGRTEYRKMNCGYTEILNLRRIPTRKRVILKDLQQPSEFSSIYIKL